ELMQQVAVRAMDLDEVEADAVGALGGRDECRLQRFDLSKRVGLRRVPARRKGNGGCRFRLPGILLQRIGMRLALPGALAGCLAARVAELDTNLRRAVALAGSDDALHRGFVLVVGECGATVRDPAGEL